MIPVHHAKIPVHHTHRAEDASRAALLFGSDHNMSHDNPAFTGSTPAVASASGEPARYGSAHHTVLGVSDGGGRQNYSPTAPPAYESALAKEREASGGVYVVGDGLAVSRKASSVYQDYLPHAERDVDHPINNWETMLHLLKGSIGTGILAMPNAFMNAGYAVGLVGTVVIGLICTYCIHMLLKSQYELCRRRRIPSFTYQEVAIAALEEGPRFLRPIAPYSGHIVNAFLLVYQIGTCCVYVVFVSTNIQAVVNEYWEDGPNVRIYMLMILLPLIAINLVRNLKLLAPFTMLANVLTLAGFSITLYYLFTDMSSIHDREAFGSAKGLPLFLGTVLFAMEAIGVILPLENSMKTPKSFGGTLGVLNRSMLLIITLYVAMGFFGYLKYGESAEGSITLNLPKEEVLAQCVKIMLAISIFITHSLQCYVAIDIVWNGYLAEKLEKHAHKNIFEYLVRIGIVLVTFLLAVAIPNLELFISLFGALCLSALGIAFPAIMETCVFWTKDTTRLRFVVMVIKNSLLFIFATTGLVIGTYTSLSDIIEEFS